MNVTNLIPTAITTKRSQPRPSAVQSSAPKDETHLGKRNPAWYKPLYVACSLLALSNNVKAADLQSLAPIDPPASHQVIMASKSVPKHFFSVGQQNDSLPSALDWLPTSASNRNPKDKSMDDNGWTAEVRADYARTVGNDQLVGSLRGSMLTQRGSWAPGPDYHGYRTDFLEVGLQKNTAHPISDSTTVYTGYGVGAQAFGAMGGHDTQLFVHTQLPFGGRTDAMGLQQNYTTHGVAVTPELTGGIGISHSLDQAKSLTWTSTLEGNLALGRGISTLRAETGLNYDLTSRIHLGAGVSLDGVYNNQPAAKFMHDSGLRVGEYVQGDVNITKNTHLFARVQLGGIQKEPLYMVGVSFGGGARPWLNPLFH